MRHETQLLPLTGEFSRSRFAVVDIETKDGESQRGGFTRPFLAGTYDSEKYVSFGGPQCLAQMLGLLMSEENEGMTYYAHNGGGFDWLHFLPLLEAGGYYYEILTVGSTIQMLSVKRSRESKRAPWRFLDSMKLIPMSLAKACHTFRTAVKKQEMNYDTHEDDPRWNEYLRADCVSLYQVLVRYHDLVEINLRGEVGITAASTAMKTFRRAYLRGPIERNTEFEETFRAAYFGGRVEIHRAKAEGLHYYDLNSCYPYVMRELMPVGPAQSWEGRPPQALVSGSVGFAQATVYVPDSIQIPILPVRHPKSKRLIFPVGRFTGTWSAAELFAAEKQGARITWHDSVWMRGEPILREMVDDLYAYRDKSREDYDDGLACVAKILLNSLYGKFGMAHEREKLVILQLGDEIPENARPAQPTNPDCRIWHVPENCDAAYIIPQIAAHITALARLTLHKYLTLAAERGVLAYCDTDSILTTANLSEFCSAKLGALKDEGDGVIYRGEFLQPKVYRLDGSDGSIKLAMKGYRSKQPEDFEKIKRGDVISFDTLEKIGSMAAHGFSRGPQMRTIIRQIKTADEKRIYLDDGSTRPLSFPL